MTEIKAMGSEVLYRVELDLWQARVFVIDEFGGKNSKSTYCVSRWGARLWVWFKMRKLERLRKKGLLS